jgi:hypothetical protein
MFCCLALGLPYRVQFRLLSLRQIIDVVPFQDGLILLNFVVQVHEFYRNLIPLSLAKRAKSTDMLSCRDVLQGNTKHFYGLALGPLTLSAILEQFAIDCLLTKIVLIT